MEIDEKKLGEFLPPEEAKKNGDRDFLVKYKSETFNLTKFLHKHPGGLGTLGALKNCDLTKVMDSISPHSEAAFYLLGEYKVQRDCNNNYECNGDTARASDKDQGGSFRESPVTNGYTTANRTANGHSQHKQDFDVPPTNGLRFDKDYLFGDNGHRARGGPDDDGGRLEVIIGLLTAKVK